MLVLCFSIICEAEGSNIPQHISRELAIIFNSTKIRFFVMRLNFSFACVLLCFGSPWTLSLGRPWGRVCVQTRICAHICLLSYIAWLSAFGISNFTENASLRFT